MLKDAEKNPLRYESLHMINYYTLWFLYPSVWNQHGPWNAMDPIFQYLPSRPTSNG